MKAEYLANTFLTTLLDPAAGIWRTAPSQKVALVGTLAAMQPTEALRNNWADRPIGAVTELSVASLHNGEILAFLLRWKNANPVTDNGDNSVFPDGAAVALPLAAKSPLMTMGAPGAGLDIWFWRADQPATGRELTAEGPGTTETLSTDLIRTASLWQDDLWSVVIARPLAGSGQAQSLPLTPGINSRCGFAIWQGASGERGGIKSFSAQWLDLQLADRR